MGNDRIIIIGAGMAGVSTAYFLTQRGIKNILIIEKENMAGTHSSGLNAAILRTMIAEPELNRLARESADFYLAPPADFSSELLVDRTGIYLAASRGNEPILQKWCNDNPETGMKPIDVATVYERIPVLTHGLGMAMWKENDGVMDVHAILHGFLRGARRSGAEVRTGVEFYALRADNGRVTGIETSAGFMEASKVVIANGAWASLSATFGVYSLPFVAHRRHLLITEVLPQVDSRWPVMWIAGEEFYFRPESGGLLMCGCDAVAVTPDQGETTDTAQIESIATKASRWLPSLEDVRVANAWAGMRTFAADDLFVIGADPRLEGLYWNAGLGGHGVTCAPLHGRLAADWIANDGSAHPVAESLSPARLIH